ncbi:MAG: hypothetical protein IJS68_02055 [Clostridia bacterium]|nr:hypothetical protein [Clostridia bacterium]
MKNIFIGGVARSGKGTLAEMIKEKCPKYNHISLDYFTASLKENFPETGIKTSVIIGDSSPKLALLLSKTMDIMNDKQERFIIDSAHIMPHDILKYIDRSKWDVIFLGYPRTTTEEKIKIVLENDDEKDWTRKKTYDELFYRIDCLIKISKAIEEECNELDITFVDTSTNFNAQIQRVAEKYKQ